MSPTPHCKTCGAEMPRDAAEGLCPRCVARLAFGDEPPAPQPGTKLRYFGDYELLEEIARGGMGVVFKARQLSLHRFVAVKMILRGEFAGETERQRFRSEAEAAANLQHPNIVMIHEVGEHDGQPYFSMDLVQGRNLAAIVKDGPLTARRAAAYLETIAEAIHHAHQKNTLHRDLKPSNVLIDEFDQPRITDFGLAKRLSGPEPGTRNSELTETGQVLGTPSFAPPEQVGGRREDIGPASDVYALGALLFFVLTGKPPFTGKNLEDTLAQVLTREATSPRGLNATIPLDLETICLKCLEKNPARRYASALELAGELGRFLRDEPIVARPINAAERIWRLCRRHRLVTGFGVALALMIAAVALLVWERKAREAALQPGDVGGPPMASLPVRSGHGVAGEIAGKFYVATPADGYAGEKRFFHVYDPAANSWQRLADTPVVFWDAVAGVIDETFFVAGGWTGDWPGQRATNSLWAFDMRTQSWRPKSPMPTVRCNAAAAVFHGRFYVIGGFVGTNILATVEAYDTRIDRWTTETPLPTPRSHCGAAVVGDAIYVVGGNFGLGGLTDITAAVESWRPGQAWVSRGSLPTPVSSAFVAAVNDTLYAAGGKAAFNDTAELQAFQLQFNNWAPLRPMPEVRYHGSGAVALDGKLYVFGGWNALPGSRSLPHPDVFIYDTRRNAWTRSK